MSLNILFAGDADKYAEYGAQLRVALAAKGIAATVSDAFAPDCVDFIVYEPTSGLADFAPYVRTKAVLSLWAGVENIVTNASLTQPLARMADSGLRDGMVEWVTGHVLRHHLGMDTHIHGQDGVWRAGINPPLAKDRRVTILGLGALGQACATALRGLGFAVSGWARTAKDLPDIQCFAGEDGLTAVLTGTEIVVLLLPLTDKTRHMMNARNIALLAPGAFVINPGRGPLIDDDALLAALDAGQVAHATLDVFATEPLPPAHPYWAHPFVTVTPHIASATRASTACEFVVRNIARVMDGKALLAQVDRGESY